MITFLRRFVILIVGLILVAAPTLVRDELWQYNARSYIAPDIPDLALAATPLPTNTPVPPIERTFARTSELRAGPVVLDLAHYNSINPSALQPLADSLADRGLGLRYWLSAIDVMSVVNYLDYPDQSEALAAELADASALIVISPFFLWSSQEIALVEQFVADGGRLLLISDPDILGDYAAATNMIGEPFGLVFNEDYLYDTTINDGNFTFFFQEVAAADDESGNGDSEDGEPTTTLRADANIAFYGGRSLSGDLRALLYSVDSTLSSLRVGHNHFVTAGIAGTPERGTSGRVLALGDLDVLTEPYRQRHDNQALVDYVAGFLSADKRINRVVDFPDYLGKEVSLAFGASEAINADLIIQGAQIQQALEKSGRTLTLRDSTPLTGTRPSTAATNDLIYLAAYTTAISRTTLLSDLGIEFYSEIVTETVQIESEPTEPTESSKDARDNGTAEDETLPSVPSSIVPSTPLTPTEPLSATQPLSETSAITLSTGITENNTTNDVARVELDEEGTALDSETTDDRATTDVVTTTVLISETTQAQTMPQFEVRTIITTYLHLDSGLTFLADETVLIVHMNRADDESERSEQEGRDVAVLAVLAANNRGIDAGVNRLLQNDFSGCVIGELLSFCALDGAEANESGSVATGGDKAAEESDASTTGTSDNGRGDGSPSIPDSPTPPRGAEAPILLIDDNRAAADGELSEADRYLQILIAGGYQVDLWSAADQGVPTVDDLMAYGWVIWSNGGYATGAIGGQDLDTIFTYINANGRITISSRTPLPGIEEVAPIRDFVTEETIPALVSGLPDTAITLVDEGGSAAVLNALAEEDEATQVVLRRGPTSDNPDAPALVVLADPSNAESEARLMIAALSMTWLPDEEQTTLIRNMAAWMLAP